MPLLERVKLAAIWSSNLDEFFQIRVAGVHDQIDAGLDRARARRADAVGDDRRDPRARRSAQQQRLEELRARRRCSRRWPSTASGSCALSDALQVASARRSASASAARSSPC